MDDDEGQAALLTRSGNLAVIQLRGRASPAIAMQGDTLSIVVALARELLARAQDAGDEAMLDVASELCETLGAAQTFYEEALAVRGMQLPYVKKTR